MVVKKTTAMRVLDLHGAEYEVLLFPEEIHDAEGVAQQIGADPSVVYKTLVVEDPGEPRAGFLVMAPGDSSLDLKQTAAALGRKKVRLVSYKDAEKRTGLKVGGISALALLNRGFKIYLARQAAQLDSIVISAGKRGINLRLDVEDLIWISEAEWLDCC